MHRNLKLLSGWTQIPMESRIPRIWVITSFGDLCVTVVLSMAPRWMAIAIDELGWLLKWLVIDYISIWVLLLIREWTNAWVGSVFRDANVVVAMFICGSYKRKRSWEIQRRFMGGVYFDDRERNQLEMKMCWNCQRLLAAVSWVDSPECGAR